MYKSSCPPDSAAEQLVVGAHVGQLAAGVGLFLAAAGHAAALGIAGQDGAVVRLAGLEHLVQLAARLAEEISCSCHSLVLLSLFG